MGVDDVILRGSMKQEAFNQLQSAVKSELTLSMNDNGKLSYTQNDSSTTLSADAQQLASAINDNSVVVNVTAENKNKTSSGSLMVGGAFMGNNIIGSGIDSSIEGMGNKVVTQQEINPTVLGTMDNENGTLGALTLHEVTESYQGALIVQQSGTSVGPATSADMNNPNSVFMKAHNAATPQTSNYNTIRYDSNGNILLNNKGTATRADFTTQKGTLLFSIP